MHSNPENRSPWMADNVPLSFPPLTAPITVDVCVVGAGIAGMSVGYLLAKTGRSVGVVDHSSPGSGGTSRKTGHL